MRKFLLLNYGVNKMKEKKFLFFFSSGFLVRAIYIIEFIWKLRNGGIKFKKLVKLKSQYKVDIFLTRWDAQQVKRVHESSTVIRFSARSIWGSDHLGRGYYWATRTRTRIEQYNQQKRFEIFWRNKKSGRSQQPRAHITSII